jgi:phage terminase large subunit GpA-like protein
VHKPCVCPDRPNDHRVWYWVCEKCGTASMRGEGNMSRWRSYPFRHAAVRRDAFAVELRARKALVSSLEKDDVVSRVVTRILTWVVEGEA